MSGSAVRTLPLAVTATQSPVPGARQRYEQQCDTHASLGNDSNAAPSDSKQGSAVSSSAVRTLPLSETATQPPVTASRAVL